MQDDMHPNRLDRRQVLSAGALSFAAPWVFTPRAWSWNGDRPRILVLLELEGGVDGLSALVPYDDPHYHRLRPKLGLREEAVFPIADGLGLPNRMERMGKLLEAGRLAIVQSVGRPRASLSHFRELLAWHEATADGTPATEGWIGRLRSQVWGDDPRPELVTHVGANPPRSLHSVDHPPFSFLAPEHLVAFGAGEADGSMSAADTRAGQANEDRIGQELDQAVRDLRIERVRRTLELTRGLAGRVREVVSSYRPIANYPRTGFAAELRHVAALIQSGFGARIYSLRHKGYDAHSVGCGCTTTNLGQLSAALHAFVMDLRGSSAEHDVLVLGYSEFGRRVAENASGGTDHGAAGPMWLLGSSVEPGLHGVRPSLSDLDENGNLRWSIDFRTVYAAVLEHWLDVRHERVLGARLALPAILKPQV